MSTQGIAVLSLMGGVGILRLQKTATTKWHVTISGLTGGQMVYFRIACLNGAGLGHWSDAIGIKVY